ncbi:hypothetical protein OH77DRAFT_1593350 [Trametes cingulata]|nr:hypothetical protein OH77DRAFT_1593350 [Trametes cingulata]
MARTSVIRRAARAERARTPASKFPSPFVFNDRMPITLVELRMRRFSGMIRSKADWWEKVKDPELRAKWRKEMVEQDRAAVEQFWGGSKRFDYGRGEKQWPRDPITDVQLDYIFDQLEYEASQRDPATGIFATSIPKVYESRSLIPADLKSTLVSGVSILESVPDEEKDWHPGSDGQVLDLVHPSLYCLRIGESLVRFHAEATDTNSIDGDTLRIMEKEEYMSLRPDLDPRIAYVVSSEYQWLPTDFEVSEEADVVALSYINNLHPIQHRSLYPTISSILSRFVPLFERVLSDTLGPEPPLAVDVDPLYWYEHVDSPDWDNLECLPGEDRDECCRRWEREHRWPLIPEPAPFSPPCTDRRVDFKLRGRTMQVIVKLANIILTPEKPRYLGGSWHVEGMANEKIVATGLYYYDCKNITESRLDFRTVVGEGEDNGRGMLYEDMQTLSRMAP